MNRGAPVRLYAGLIALLCGLSLLSLAAGRVWISPAVLFGGGPEGGVLLDLRLPRTLLALVEGAALGFGGAALQGYTRNPLAEPTLLGVSSTALLGAVLSLYFGLTAAAPWLLPTAAVIGAIVGVALLLALSGLAGSTVTFVLAGVVLQTVAGSAVALALSLAPSPWAAGEIINWLMGSLQDRSLQELAWAAIPSALGAAFVLAAGRGLDALTLGEIGARSLGVDLGRMRTLLTVGVGLATGGCVAAAGAIGFVGLITPHLLRPLVGARPSALLVPSALGGAALLLGADIVVRVIPSADEVRLGIAMSALGAPFFLALLLRQRRRLA